ncbi:MAG: threonine synthase [Betaproteobacteria bacterium]|nr:MAG: threonine synthase [Betaproteobacteria bacterium]
MRYVSTRGGMPPQPFTSILIEGLAPDGGLVVPDRYPRLTTQDLARMRHLGYQDLAFEILSRYIDDIAPADLKSIIARTYTVATFGSEEITPLATLEPGLHLLRLANGPTLAFKDIALQLLGNLFEHVLAKEGATLNILGATSGDTGSSAEYAMRGKRGISVFMLSPRGRMTAFQTAQMYALSEPNIFNIAIEGVFDDCQDIVKKIAGDREFKRRWRLGAVNSINWARVAAQVVYYFKAYFAATRNEEEAVAFAVPSGNFGNILAGHVARQMGLPIRRLIVATNENDVLDEFFRTGRYMARDFAKVVATSSPSMDISKASNFERLVFDLADRDPATVLALWDQLDREGGFDVSGTPLAAKLRTSSFVSGRSTHADRITTIRSIAEKHRVVVDPHTADGIKVGLANREPGVPLICVETALPVKFAQTIAEALGREPERPRAYIGLEELPQRCAVLGVDADAVKAYIAEHALA